MRGRRLQTCLETGEEVQARGERTVAQKLMPSMNPRFLISGVVTKLCNLLEMARLAWWVTVTKFCNLLEMARLAWWVSTPEIKNRGFPHMVKVARAWMRQSLFSHVCRLRLGCERCCHTSELELFFKSRPCSAGARMEED